MLAPNCSLQKILICLGVILMSQISTAFGQSKQNQASAEQAEDVVRINTELVQTDVMVFDKRGRFVEGLRQEDFELRIDGKSKPISFFDRVSAGSRSEELQLAAARGESRANTTADAGPAPLDRGRLVFFFVDGVHLGPNTLSAVRNVLS